MDCSCASNLAHKCAYGERSRDKLCITLSRQSSILLKPQKRVVLVTLQSAQPTMKSSVARQNHCLQDVLHSMIYTSFLLTKTTRQIEKSICSHQIERYMWDTKPLPLKPKLWVGHKVHAPDSANSEPLSRCCIPRTILDSMSDFVQTLGMRFIPRRPNSLNLLWDNKAIHMILEHATAPIRTNLLLIWKIKTTLMAAG
jgi:hypothetical protein